MFRFTTMFARFVPSSCETVSTPSPYIWIYGTFKDHHVTLPFAHTERWAYQFFQIFHLIAVDGIQLITFLWLEIGHWSLVGDRRPVCMCVCLSNGNAKLNFDIISQASSLIYHAFNHSGGKIIGNKVLFSFHLEYISISFHRSQNTHHKLTKKKNNYSQRCEQRIAAGAATTKIVSQN